MIVASAATAGYARPLAVMIRSLLAHYAGPEPVSFSVFDLGIDARDKLRLEQLCREGGACLQWLHIDESRLSGLPAWRGVHRATYARLYLAEFFPPDTSRAIWLDADIVIQADLARLWAEPLQDRALLAAQDLVVPYVSSRYGVNEYRSLSLPPRAKYFNAGVMVVNLSWWREQDVSGKVLEYLRRVRRRVYFYDQEGLNAVLCGRWGELDPRWNQIASVAGRRFFRAGHLPPEQYRDVVERPWIVHFAGSWKPWTMRMDAPQRALYFKYLDQTAWSGWRPRPSAGAALRRLYDGYARISSILWSISGCGFCIAGAIDGRVPGVVRPT